MDEQTAHKATTKKRRKPRVRKNKNPKEHFCKSYISNVHHSTHIFILINNFNFLNIVADNEELKVHPALGDDAFNYADRHFDNEETRVCALFIAEYHQTKIAQDFDNQSVLSDLDEERYYGNTEYKLRLNQ